MIKVFYEKKTNRCIKQTYIRRNLIKFRDLRSLKCLIVCHIIDSFHNLCMKLMQTCDFNTAHFALNITPNEEIRERHVRRPQCPHPL